MELIKKHASSFLQHKYNIARLAFTDVTEAELLAEEATNGDSCSPDPRIMSRIAEACYNEVDDYWRIVDVLHRRLCCVDWNEWRQAYKALVVLEFLLTHGPLDFSQEFVCDSQVIHQLATFQFVDHNGINWGENMQRKSDEILKLLGGSTLLKEARLKALKVKKEIYGFGFGPISSNMPIMEPSSANDNNYSVGGISCSSHEQDHDNTNVVERLHLWDSPNHNSTHESGYFLDDDEEEFDHHKERLNNGFVGGIFSKLTNTFNPLSSSSSSKDYGRLRSVSDVGRRESNKKYNRQSSLWY
ncbi:hypothetical protein CsatB_025249 [Cannabis sativa]